MSQSGTEHYSLSRRRFFSGECAVLSALAHAIAGRTEQAETKLVEAFSEAELFSKYHLAALLHLKGVTRHAMGDCESAREAFHESLRVFPFGGIGLKNRKSLSELAQGTDTGSLAKS